MKTIKSEMVDFPFVVEPEMTVAEAQTFMSQQDLRHLPVVDSKNKLLGVISERDVLKSKSPNESVTSVMIKDVFVVAESEDLAKVIQKMADEKFGSVLVVNSANELTGIFTTINALNLLSKFLNEDKTVKKSKISLLDIINS